ncbi:MAG TPA: glycosyltransferase family 4 protein [Thermoanaerobaculia bacterium]|jgi:glycosyltransferase involved in cell wall biosynthesis|nr:glycosyltransferase family 4 protein [Thermoanaerobaculia bacterium]
MRILLVSHPPLSPELGAAQVAVNLAEALRARGHAATVWSPEPLPPPVHRWTRWSDQARAIARFVADHGPFDVIDSPPISIGPGWSGQARVVARSVQPELLYLAKSLQAQLLRLSPHTPVTAIQSALAARAVVRGWHGATVILAQGTLEYEWMRRRFPKLAPRLGLFVVAPSPREQEALSALRRTRRRPPRGSGTRYLWIGRWSAQKGIRSLVRFIERRAATLPGDTFTLAGCGAAAAKDVPPRLLAEGRVRVLPFFARGELPGILAEHDAGLFTSVVEGWGLCLNEMLESGLEVFATPTGGVPDLAPYWGSMLRPFPPPLVATDRAGPEPDLAAYFARFSWPAIGRHYEEAVRS